MSCKSKYINHIILEGCDGVGKDTIMNLLWPMYDFKYRVYMRGEISDYVYAKKYHREFISTQRGLPFLYVILVKDKEEIKQQIINRGIDVKNELKKINDQDLFLMAQLDLYNDYHIIKVNISNLKPEDAAKKIYEKTTLYIDSLSFDEEVNSFNEMYELGAKKLNLYWATRNNQPFLNNRMIMADAQLHNGRFETYDDKSMPHNLIFSLAYTYQNKDSLAEFYKRPYDFAYPINSKILVRHEIYDYIKSIVNYDKTILTTESDYIKNTKIYQQHKNNIRLCYKCFGDIYISTIENAKATFYCSRDLAYLEMMTVRCYEAVLANQIIFVDKLTDPQCKILKQIHKNDTKLIDLLYCNEITLCKNYDIIINDKTLVQKILINQRAWYKKLVKDLYKNGVRL